MLVNSSDHNSFVLLVVQITGSYRSVFGIDLIYFYSNVFLLNDFPFVSVHDSKFTFTS